MQQHEIGDIFKRRFKYGNFMTPEVVGYYKRGPFLFELSTGRGLFPGTVLWGVTVLTLMGESCHDISRCFDTREAAKRYIGTINTAENREKYWGTK